jgi:hypothetical protein
MNDMCVWQKSMTAWLSCEVSYVDCLCRLRKRLAEDWQKWTTAKDWQWTTGACQTGLPNRLAVDHSKRLAEVDHAKGTKCWC